MLHFHQYKWVITGNRINWMWQIVATTPPWWRPLSCVLFQWTTQDTVKRYSNWTEKSHPSLLGTWQPTLSLRENSSDFQANLLLLWHDSRWVLQNSVELTAGFQLESFMFCCIQDKQQLKVFVLSQCFCSQISGCTYIKARLLIILQAKMFCQAESPETFHIEHEMICW